MYVSRVKWSNPGKGVAPYPHLCVVAIEKGAFCSPSITVAKFTYLYGFYKWNVLLYCSALLCCKHSEGLRIL